MFKEQLDRHDFHRMNHLDIHFSDFGSELITAKVPHPDRIDITRNGAEYDFSKLPIDIIGARYSDYEKLQCNPSLDVWKSGRFLCFFKVVRKK